MLIDIQKVKTITGLEGGGSIPPFSGFANWNADTNTPTLTSGMPGDPGIWYRVIIAGSTNLDGITDWKVGDFAVFNDSTMMWIKVDNSEPVPVPPAYGEMFFRDNFTPTVITSQGSPVIVDATYVGGELQDFTHVTGKLTYEGAVTRLFDVKVNLTASLDQVNANISVLIAKDGVVIAESKQTIDCDGTTPSFKSIGVSKLVSLSQFNKIEVFIQNNDGTDNITVQDMSVIVGAPGFVGAASDENNIFSQTQEVQTVANSASPEILNGTGVGSLSFQANSLKVGDSFLFRLGGAYSRALLPGGDTLILKLAAGSVVFFDTPALTLSGNQTLSGYAVDVFMTVQAVGGPGVARIQSSIVTSSLFTGGGTRLYVNNTTFDTTVNNVMTLTAQFNNASTFNIINSRVLTLSRV